jgi:hypothetical protein
VASWWWDQRGGEVAANVRAGDWGDSNRGEIEINLLCDATQGWGYTSRVMLSVLADAAYEDYGCSEAGIVPSPVSI